MKNLDPIGITLLTKKVRKLLADCGQFRADGGASATDPILGPIAETWLMELCDVVERLTNKDDLEPSPGQEGKEIALLTGELAALRGEVREWACEKCNFVYPGPPQTGFACVRCPRCGGGTMPKTFLERRKLLSEKTELQSDVNHLCRQAREMRAALGKIATLGEACGSPVGGSIWEMVNLARRGLDRSLPGEIDRRDKEMISSSTWKDTAMDLGEDLAAARAENAKLREAIGKARRLAFEMRMKAIVCDEVLCNTGVDVVRATDGPS